MKNATIIAVILGMFCFALCVALPALPGPIEQVLATEQARNTAIAEAPTEAPFVVVLPETCTVPPPNSFVRIGQEYRGTLLGCALDAFGACFPGCGNPATDPEAFVLELYNGWLSGNGYNIDELSDNNNDGVVDPIVHPNDIFQCTWREGSWSE